MVIEKTFTIETRLDQKQNPAYTSKIAEQKYCKQKKLVIHQGASFVIARKGQGFIDKYIKNSKRKEVETVKQNKVV